MIMSPEELQHLINAERRAIENGIYEPLSRKTSSNWEEIYHQIVALRSTDVDISMSWTFLVKCGLPDVLFQALDITMEKDTMGCYSVEIGSCILLLWGFRDVLAQPGSFEPQVIGPWNLLAKRTPQFLQDWWTKYKEHIHEWDSVDCGVEYNRWTNTVVRGSMTMLEAARSVRGRSTGTEIEHVEAKLQSSSVVQEWWMYHVVNCPWPPSPESPNEIASAVGALVASCHPKAAKFNHSPIPTDKPEELYSRCVFLLQEAARDPLPFKFELIFSFIDILTRHETLALRFSNQLFTVARAVWPWCRKGTDSYKRGMLVRCLNLIVRLQMVTPLEDRARVTKQLLEDEDVDFFTLTGTCVYLWCSSEPEPGTEDTADPTLWDTILNICTIVGPIKPSIRDCLMNCDWLGTADLLETSHSHRGDKARPFWDAMGKLAGMDKKAMRTQAIEARTKASGGIAGCSWYKCIMHRQPTELVMHWCLGCHSVVYCGFMCQERDWEEGHMDVCGKQTTAVQKVNGTK